MKNKMVIAIMLVLLAINFYAWNKVTVENDRIIKDIYKTLETCKVSNG